MKRFSVIIILFSVIVSSAYAYKIKMSEYAFDAEYGLMDMDAQGNKIVVACCGIRANKFHETSVFLCQNNVWSKLPLTCNVDGKEEKVLSSLGHIVFDKHGDIWLSGKYLYKYSGGTWKAYFVNDEYKDIRKYLGLVVDANGYVWVSTSYYMNVDNYGSSLLRFKDNNLEEIIKTNDISSIGQSGNSGGANAMVAFPDSSVGVQMPISFGGESGNKQDLFRFYPDGRVEKSVIDQLYYSVDKTIQCMYAESDGKLWVGESKSSYLTGEDEEHLVMKYQTSGLAYYDGRKWMRFGVENNLQELQLGPYMNMPVNWIEKAKNGKYFVLTSRYLNLMGDDLKLRIIDWDTVFSRMTLIKSNSSIQDTVYEWQSEAYHTKANDDDENYLDFKKMKLTDNNELLILGDQGLFVMDANSYAPAEDIKDVQLTISPNPAINTIRIDHPLGIARAEIINTLGETVLSVTNLSEPIDISALSSGVYIVKLVGSKNEVVFTKFIKGR